MTIPFSVLRQYIAPQRALSRFAGWMANSKVVWLKNYLIKDFIRRYKVDMSEAIEQNPTAFSCYNDFFTRKLKPELRVIAPENSALISPVDGCIQALGQIFDGSLFQAKKHTFSLETLLGNNPETAKKFLNGTYFTIYLSPPDYHRIHMPLTGKLTDMWYVPGKLFSVNILTAEHIPGLFARNERVVCLFETEWGPMVVILIGAMLVGSMHTTWAGCVAPNGYGNVTHWNYNKTQIMLKKGDDLGYFTLGSTVMVLLPEGKSELLSTLEVGQRVKMGERMGKMQ